MAFSPDAAVIATGGTGGEVRVSDARTGELQAAIPASATFTRALAFSPDGRLIAAGSADGLVACSTGGQAALCASCAGTPAS